VVSPPQQPLNQSPLCVDWRASRQSSNEGTWIDGNRARCEPGDISEDGRENALARVNYYRSLAGVPPVETTLDLDTRAQSCALLLHANGKLSHEPPAEWSCWSKVASQAAYNSNLANVPGVLAVDGYMIDGGNETTLGHRRWILSPWITTIGLGSVVSSDDATGGMSCLWVSPKKAAKGEADSIAWPPAGSVPFEIVNTLPRNNHASLDTTGWSIQSDKIDFSKATFHIRANSEDLPVKTDHLTEHIGSKWALAGVPQGWQVEPETTYSVEVTGVKDPIAYNVTFVRCEAP